MPGKNATAKHQQSPDFRFSVYCMVVIKTQRLWRYTDRYSLVHIVTFWCCEMKFGWESNRYERHVLVTQSVPINTFSKCFHRVSDHRIPIGCQENLRYILSYIDHLQCLAISHGTRSKMTESGQNAILHNMIFTAYILPLVLKILWHYFWCDSLLVKAFSSTI